MTSPRTVFNNSDAWIFASIGEGISPNDEVSLRSLIGNADYMNHAIPTYEELVSATKLLFQNGLVKEGTKGLLLTEYGQSVSANGFSSRGGLFSVVDNILVALNSDHSQHPQIKESPTLHWLTLSKYHDAIAEYLSLFGRR